MARPRHPRLGSALTPFMTSGLGLIFSLGLLSAIGSGAGSFSVLIGAAAQRLAAEERGKAAGIINAGGSFGQFVFAPIVAEADLGLRLDGRDVDARRDDARRAAARGPGRAETVRATEARRARGRRGRR